MEQILSVSIVVPVYESSHSLVELTQRVHAVFARYPSETFEILLVDDGSRSPATGETLRTLRAEYPAITVIRLMRNFGRIAAVLCGLKHARGRNVIIMDDDLQHRPEDIPALLEHRDHDIVVAQFPVRNHDTLTVLGSWVKSHFDRIILGLPCRISAFVSLRRDVVDAMLQMTSPRPFLPALMASVTSDFHPIVLSHDASKHGRSRYSFMRRFVQFTNLLIGNSNLVLHAFGIIGGVVAAAGFLSMFVIIVLKFSGRITEAGWASLVVINLLFGGLILVALGIIGEYLLRILEGGMQKPTYVVRGIYRGKN
jgi:glycosyltransferase involved in cell wall biosynthesis